MRYEEGGYLRTGTTFIRNDSGEPEQVVSVGTRGTVDVGAYAGWRVMENSLLKEQAIYLLPESKTIVCGRVSHLQYTIAVAAVRIAIRNDLQEMLDAFAKRVGVDRSTIRE